MFEEINCDLAVVGGGPAGLSAGWAAAQQGVRVLILERNREMGCPIRTTGATWTQEMTEMGIPPALYHPIPRITFRSPKESYTYQAYPPSFCILDVRRFHQFLAEKGLEAGANLMTGTLVTEPVLESGAITGLKAITPFGPLKVRCRVAIDASGISSVLARKVGLYKEWKRIGNGVEVELFDPSWDQEEALFEGGRDISPAGYAWFIPAGRGRVKVGLVVIRPDSEADPLVLLKRLIEDRFPQAGVIEFHRGLIPWEGMRGRSYYPGLLTIGDAAGQLSPLAGEGIRYALEVGRLVGEEVGKALKDGPLSQETLTSLDKKMGRRYQKDFQFALTINRMTASFKDEDWDLLIRAISKLKADQVYSLMRSRFSTHLLTHLGLAEPRLFKFMARSVIW